MKPNTLKKEYAKLLFTSEKLSQKEISEKVGVSEQTITRWVNANSGEWRRLRQSLFVTKREQLSRIYDQIGEITNSIIEKEQGKRYADSKEADTLVKLTSAAKTLETEASVADKIDVTMKFLDWLRPIDLELAKRIAPLFNSFIKDSLS